LSSSTDRLLANNSGVGKAANQLDYSFGKYACLCYYSSCKYANALTEGILSAKNVGESDLKDMPKAPHEWGAASDVFLMQQNIFVVGNDHWSFRKRKRLSKMTNGTTNSRSLVYTSSTKATHLQGTGNEPKPFFWYPKGLTFVI